MNETKKKKLSIEKKRKKLHPFFSPLLWKMVTIPLKNLIFDKIFKNLVKIFVPLHS